MTKSWLSLRPLRKRPFFSYLMLDDSGLEREMEIAANAAPAGRERRLSAADLPSNLVLDLDHLEALATTRRLDVNGVAFALADQRTSNR